MTILTTFVASSGRHLITSAVMADGAITDTRQGMAREVFMLGQTLVKRAIAEGNPLDTRGDRYEYNGDSIVVEAVTR